MKEFSFKDWTRQLRESLGLSQAQFASRLGVTHGAVNKWEKGLAQARPLIKTKMAEMAPEHLRKQSGLPAGHIAARKEDEISMRLNALEEEVRQHRARLAVIELELEKSASRKRAS